MPEIVGSKAAPAGRSVVRRVILEALAVVCVSAVVAIVVNTVRSDGIAWVQHEPYAILVPCAESVGEAEWIGPSDPIIHDTDSLVVDVRLQDEFDAWHISDATNQPFDWLGPPVDKEVEAVARRIASSGARRVVVYGDGDDPDSGREWARLLSGARIKNVYFVGGGAPALQQAAEGTP